MREKLLELCDRYEMELLEQVPLSEHTTFRIGGKADYWVNVSLKTQLSALLRFCKEEKLPYFIMGRGSNVLASDEGYRGLIIHLDGTFTNCEMVNEDGTELQAPVEATCVLKLGAAESLVKAAKIAEEFGLTGMEGLSGIPGTVGGALFMNAGAYNYEMSQIVTSCEYMDEDGELHTLTAEELALTYRHSWFTDHPGNVILFVTVKLAPGNREEISAKMQELLKRRSEKQPLNYPSAGSTFKRPKVGYASALIDQCGLKGLTYGGAQVSEKHAGFVVNRFDATCDDVTELCRQVREKVKADTGTVLDLEPVLLGNVKWESD
ncbi:MAG: UDP-N-acetylmuramate dehydrogenase [Oscillospiraceae bacterium]|nr:UDP-N-acetylmuramate dehydrogenase [Oscillospiraceae bacterium]